MELISGGLHRVIDFQSCVKYYYVFVNRNENVNSKVENKMIKERQLNKNDASKFTQTNKYKHSIENRNDRQNEK